MAQPDFEALWRKAVDAYGVAYDAAPGPLGARSRIRAGDEAAIPILREAFEAQLAELRAKDSELLTIAWLDGAHRSAKVVRHIADLQAREAEHLATIERLREALANPPRHRFWGAGEPDCPREIKCSNGELHTLRCKVCGEENPLRQICQGGFDAD